MLDVYALNVLVMVVLAWLDWTGLVGIRGDRVRVAGESWPRLIWVNLSRVFLSWLTRLAELPWLTGLPKLSLLSGLSWLSGDDKEIADLISNLLVNILRLTAVLVLLLNDLGKLVAYERVQCWICVVSEGIGRIRSIGVGVKLVLLISVSSLWVGGVRIRLILPELILRRWLLSSNLLIVRILRLRNLLISSLNLAFEFQTPLIMHFVGVELSF